MNLRRAAEMALKYFEDAHGLEDTEVAIKEALHQALTWQWVCCVCGDPKALGIVHSADAPCFHYTKREWVGLSKEEGAEIWADAHDIDGNRLVTPKEIVRRIEAKLKEKNGG